MDSLGIKLLQAIEDTYNKKYVGVIKIEKLNPKGYKVSMGNPDKPIQIAAELDEDSFIKHFIQELRVSRLHEIHYFEGIRNVEDCIKCRTYEPRIIEKL